MAQGFVISLNLGEMNSRDLDTLALNNLGGDGSARDLALFSNNTNNFSIMKPQRSFAITNVTVSGSRIIYECESDFRAGVLVTITGVTPEEYNKENARVSVATDTTIEVLDADASTYGEYISGGSISGADYRIVDTNYISRANEEQVVYSNKTKIIHEGTTYTVVNSDGNDRFQLIDDEDNIFVPTGQLTRVDLITSENLKNLRPDRLDVVPARSQNEDTTAVISPSLGVDPDDVVPLVDRLTLIELYATVFEKIDLYSFRRRISIVMNDEVDFDRQLNMAATIAITNSTSQDITLADTPGLYIYNGSASIRAFSDNSDPWDTTVQASGYTTTLSSQATIRKLVVSNPDFEGISTDINSGDVGDTYTHKVPLRLNDGTGERTYFLLAEAV